MKKYYPGNRFPKKLSAVAVQQLLNSKPNSEVLERVKNMVVLPVKLPTKTATEVVAELKKILPKDWLLLGYGSEIIQYQKKIKNNYFCLTLRSIDLKTISSGLAKQCDWYIDFESGQTRINQEVFTEDLQKKIENVLK